jgi:polyhydroxyalkanoate synthesis regulator phasin
VTKHSSVFDLLKARGEEVLNQVSSELMENRHFMRALQTAMMGKEKVNQAAARALKQMNIPTRTEFKRALHRIEALESELTDLKAKATAPKRAPRKRAAKPAVASTQGGDAPAD